VAGNLCRILERELALGPAAEDRQVELLSGLLGETGDARTLNERLTQRLRGDVDEGFEAATWRALVEIVQGKLAVAKPGHDSYDFAPEAAR
jgi:hypothetical protein